MESYKLSVLGNRSPYAGMLSKLLARVRAERSGVYTTYVEDPRYVSARLHEFVTTSKDIHLKLGNLGRVGHMQLAKVLEELCETVHGAPFKLELHERDERNKGLVVLVTPGREHRASLSTWNLSPA